RRRGVGDPAGLVGRPGWIAVSERGRRLRRRRRIIAASVLTVLVVCVAVVGAYGWYRLQLRSGDGPHTEVQVEIPPGSGNADIASQLADADVVRNARAFTWRIRSSGAGPFEAGRYLFERNSSADAAID